MGAGSIGKISSDESRRPAGHRDRLEFDGCQLTTKLCWRYWRLWMARATHPKKDIEMALRYAE
ncbi:hypothetical protein, partial [Burkholderia sp. SIMBA_052]|uniref:hypothetical protein n=1 Tax=Burkholderia sp. SIMBA_052 TaxID=3085793 RepID=UPI00397A6E4A